MCGIVGYVGGQQAAPLLLEGLTRLEHRGYDSAGVAVLASNGIKVAKRAGRVRDLADGLPKRFGGKVGVGHTRWATHGPANDANAHPPLQRVCLRAADQVRDHLGVGVALHVDPVVGQPAAQRGGVVDDLSLIHI